MSSRYHGSKILWKLTKGSLGNNDGDGNENGKKSNKTISVKQQHFARASRLYAHLLAIVARLRHATQKVSFPISKLRYGPFGFNPENVTSI